jgi:pseudoazurin
MRQSNLRASRLLLIALALLFPAASAQARDWDVRMLNRGGDGTPMVFEPAFLSIRPGDRVRFVATDRGHNAEAIPGMIPQGAASFRGRINQEIVVSFTTPGLYGYKCLPHLGMGMVGLIQVGSATNRSDAAQAAGRLPGRAKSAMLGLLGQVR